MKVSLISYSQTPLYSEVSVEIEDLIGYCARVSNPSASMGADNEKLLNYLIRNKHWSPFELASICLEIETTRDIARQILRHRSFSFQEFSQRYADPTFMQFEIREARLQDHKNRQNSIETNNLALQEEWALRQQRVIAESLDAYSWALDMGIAKEVARAVLPEGLTPSRLYMNGTVRSWIHYIELRRENGTQKEHILVAQECAKAISIIFPYIKVDD